MLNQDEDAEIVEVYSGQVCNNFFVHYDDTGQVYLLSTCRDEMLKNLEISVDLIQSFLAGKKSCKDYSIEYFIEIKDGTILDTDETVDLIKSEFVFLNVPIDDAVTELTFEYNVAKQSWIIIPGIGLTNRLLAMPRISFYICKKNNPYFLYASYFLDPAQLVNGPMEIPFTTKIEETLSKISVMTLKKFRSYSIRTNDE
jgi:hypothetical protein